MAGASKVTRKGLWASCIGVAIWIVVPALPVAAGILDGPVAHVDRTTDGHPLFEPVDFRGIDEGPRFYMSALIGPSFATLVQPDLPGIAAIGNQSLLSGGGAAGWAIPRPGGGLRLEVEALARERLAVSDTDPLVGTLQLAASDNWSVMANLWRDFDITDRFGVYAGGGLGAGGYRLSFAGDAPGATVSGSTGIATFAWQAGGGLCYALTDRVTLDLGYRFYALQPGAGTFFVTNSSGTVRDTLNTQFSASELLISVRVYEPFRWWR